MTKVEILKKITDIIKKNRKIIIVAVSAFVLIKLAFFAASCIVTSRRVFYFPEVGTEKIEREVRYLSKNKSQSALENYISELLLGPQIHRARPLFSHGTSLEFCILKENTLYLGLSEDAVFQESESADFYRGVELLEMNLKKNFSIIGDIKLFAGGIYIEPKN